MSKSILTKVAAIACSAITLGALSMVVAAQTDYDPAVDENAAIYENLIEAGKVNLVAGRVDAEAGETVNYPVYLLNNSGYAGIGLKLIYEPDQDGKELTPGLTAKGKPDATQEEALKDIGLVNFAYNDGSDSDEGDKIIGLGATGTENKTESGKLYTVPFTVPEDAQPGDLYPLRLTVQDLKDEDNADIEFNAVAGWIRIPATEETTTTPAPETTTTPAPETTTTPAPETTTTPAPATTPEADTSTTPDGTTTTGDESTTTKPTTTTKGNGSSGGSTSNSGGSTAATKTGDAGVGVAAAALVLAAGTAVVATKKKKD